MVKEINKQEIKMKIVKQENNKIVIKLENGAKIKVPPFIESGDEIIIDTRSIEYVKKI